MKKRRLILVAALMVGGCGSNEMLAPPPDATGGMSGTGGMPAIDGAGGADPSGGGGDNLVDAGTTQDAGLPADARSSTDAGAARDTSPSNDTRDASGPCAVPPVTPGATQQAKNVLCYLYSQYGNHIISGQEENATGQLSAAEVEVNYIFSTTGKYPAIRSFDVNNAGNASRCLAWWQANGLCVFGYHMGAPSAADGYTGAMTAVSGGIDSVVTAGSTNNTVFNQRLDNVAAQVLQVQQGNGVVILRLFHEAGGTWFWWSKEGGAQYVKLWKYAFNYLTVTKGLKGILWLMPYDGTPQASFYPGKDFVDIAGADNYNASLNYAPMTSIFNATRAIAGMTVPIALHENGPIPDPDQLQSTGTGWLYFNTWTAPFPETATSVTELQNVYASSYVITRDEMPSLK